MDPTACLLEAQDLIDNKADYIEAGERLKAYFEWRIKGGFEPRDVAGRTGDYFYGLLINSLVGCADVMHEELEGINDAKDDHDRSYGANRR